MVVFVFAKFQRCGARKTGVGLEERERERV